jgi:hypothetical protein
LFQQTDHGKQVFTQEPDPGSGHGDDDLHGRLTANTAVVSSLRVTNRNASAAALSVNVYPSGGATAFALLKTYLLPTNQTMDAAQWSSVHLGDRRRLERSPPVWPPSTSHMSYLEIDRN